MILVAHSKRVPHPQPLFSNSYAKILPCSLSSLSARSLSSLLLSPRRGAAPPGRRCRAPSSSLYARPSLLNMEREHASRIWPARPPARSVGGSSARSRRPRSSADPPRPAPCLARLATLRRGPVWKHRRLPAAGSPRRDPPGVRDLRLLPGRRLFASRFGCYAKWVICLHAPLDRVS